MNEAARHVQTIARQVMTSLARQLIPGMTERDISELAIQEFAKRDINTFWYYGIAALVLVGDRTTLSVSGREYQPTDLKVAENDLVTVDLSPEFEGEWGDYARSIIVTPVRAYEDECPTESPLAEGISIEKELHAELVRFARPETTFNEIFEHMNRLISQFGFENLDFKGNLGHSIEQSRDLRVYIESGNHLQLAEVSRFTFEPHIKKLGINRGFKRENIYYFDGGLLKEL